MESETVPEPDAAVQETQFTTTIITTSEDQTISQDGNYSINGNVATNGSNYGTTTNLESQTQLSSKPSTKPARALAPDLLRGLLMVLQAIDHSALSVGAWPHGTAIDSESDGRIVTRWNRPVAWVCRNLTHLCAPGFMFLLGMGVVYFGKSRSKLGWSAWRMVRHFFVRAVVLVVVNILIGLPLTGRSLVILNIVLLALAFNYFTAGLVWLALTWTEDKLTGLLQSSMSSGLEEVDDSDAHRSLLRVTNQADQSPKSSDSRAASISFHIHNVFLLVLSGVTIWWNIWLSLDHGHCPAIAPKIPPTSQVNPIFGFFFYIIQNQYIVSVFPPFGWLSFAILGLLYARIVLYKSWPALRINLVNFLTGVTFALLFVATRLFHFGNLSEDCLQMAEQLAHPDRNQYLVSFRSFLYVTKYPPSPAFAFYSLSLIFLFLSAFGFVSAKLGGRIPFSILLTYGTCALFFYAIHLPIYFALGAIVKSIFGHEMDWDNQMKGDGSKTIGVSLTVFWPTWLFGLAILWVLCRWYGRFKSTKGPDSVWRFF